MGLQSSITVVGSGYVGTVVAASMATLGHDVIGVEINPEKLALLQKGTAPFFEPGLDQRLQEAVNSGRLIFTDDYELALERSEIVFLCVDTPTGENGHPDSVPSVPSCS